MFFPDFAAFIPGNHFLGFFRGKLFIGMGTTTGKTSIMWEIMPADLETALVTRPICSIVHPAFRTSTYCLLEFYGTDLMRYEMSHCTGCYV
jgi:hypothetical protein